MPRSPRRPPDPGDALGDSDSDSDLDPGPARIPDHVAFALASSDPARTDPGDARPDLRGLVDGALAHGIGWLTLHVAGACPPAPALRTAVERLVDAGAGDLAAGVRVRVAGRREGPADPALLDLVDGAARRTADNRALTLTVALNYGGRQEILDAVGALASSGGRRTTVTERALAAHLYQPDMPDPDLVVVVADERRVPDSFLWEVAYSEFVFLEGPPAGVGRADLDRAVAEYQRRHRRFGGIEG
ncbi:MAG TPA: undecaprenyl diphosphate synthase family protein [Acidimicrobiales bacterium]|nr:undecaprenyl diphosphate synthase family protein [Acidimicrobiales bacterium]